MMLVTEEATHVFRQGIYGNSLYLPLGFDVNLKLLLKNKVLKNTSSQFEKSQSAKQVE